jgi:hypothetical protein
MPIPVITSGIWMYTAAPNINVSMPVPTIINGSSAYTVQPADTQGITDSISYPIGRVRTSGDALGVSDTLSYLLTGDRLLGDGSGLVDAFGLLWGFGRSFSGTINMADSATVSMSKALSFSEALGTLDGLVTPPANYSRNVGNNLGSVDSLSFYIGHILNSVDPSILSDTFTYDFSSPNDAGFGELISLGDALQTISDTLQEFPEGLSISEIFSKAREEPETDLSGATDSISLSMAMIREFSEALGSVDVFTNDLSTTSSEAFGNALYTGDQIDIQRDSARSRFDVIHSYDGLSVQHDRCYYVDVGDTVNITSKSKTGNGTSPWSDVDGSLELLGVWDGTTIKPIYEVFRRNIIPSGG